MNTGTESEQCARILRDKQTKAAYLETDLIGKWSLHSGYSIEAIDYSMPILQGEGSGLFPLPVDKTVRHYFLLITEKGKILLADQHLPMSGCYNFRDLGGIKTKDGRYIKWGKLFRADDIAKLTDEDLAYLYSIPILSVVDFRAANEMKRTPDRLPPSVRFHHPLSIVAGNLSSQGIEMRLLKADLDEHMRLMYRSLVSEPDCVKAYKRLLYVIQNRHSPPLVFHCSAGKDRTGIAAALILFALGVDEKTVMEDYLISKVYLADKFDAFIEKYPRAEALFTVKPEYIKSAFKQIKSDHGSIDNFIKKVLDVDVEKLRSMYLY